MKIDGRLIASEIKTTLKERISWLRGKNIIPHLAVILIGNDPSSEAYVRQKLKVGEEIGAKVAVYKFSLPESGKDTSDGVRSTPPRWRKQKNELLNLVHKLNNDDSIHGIIVQRPVPIDVSKEELDLLVIPQKDVDGFRPQSPFTPPIASAVLKILEWVYKSGKDTSDGGKKAVKTPRGWQAERSEAMTTPPMVEEFKKKFIHWLQIQKILIIGRGETAGKPIAQTLSKMGVNIEIAHSKTENMRKLCLTSNIIITCVGRPYIVRHQMLKPTTLLIGVGLHQENGKLATDYDQDEIASKVAFYTPVPGGVGPVNVACLFENLIFAVKLLK